MAHTGPGHGVLDTPQTHVADTTIQRPDFADISQEASFQSPGQDGNFLQQLRNARSKGIGLRTPRLRDPLTDRRNLPQSAGAEFTPLLKSAARHSVRRGKENGSTAVNTPGLNRIDEDDMSPLPRMDTSLYTGSRNQSYMDQTLPQVDSSSSAPTPLAMPSRRDVDRGPLEDGNGLSLREQENVIDRIEKENFGLKLKIHFLEEALRKAGTGYSEAALKDNAELKVDKVTLQRELHRYKKQVTTAERELENSKQQILELQGMASRQSTDEHHQAEMDQLRQTLEAREAQIEDLQKQIDGSQRSQDQVEKLQDDITDLEADLREKERIIGEREDELEDLKDKLRDGQGSQDEVDKLQDDIADLEASVREKDRLLEEKDDELQELKDQLGDGQRFKDQVDKLQDDIADLEVDLRDKDRQISDRDDEVDELKDKLKHIESKDDEIEGLRNEVEELKADLDDRDRVLRAKHEEVQDLRTQLVEDDKADILEKLHDDMADLEAELHAKNDVIGQRDLQLEDLQSRLENAEQRARELGELRDDILEDLRGKLDDAELKAKTLEEMHGGELQSLKGKLDEADRKARDLKRLQNEIADLKADAQDKDRLLSTRDNELKGLRTKLSAADESKVIEKLQEEITDLDKKLRDKDRSLREKDRLLRTKDEEIEDLKAQLETAQDKTKDAQRQVRELSQAGQGDEATRRVQELEADLESRANDIKTLEKDLSLLTEEKMHLEKDLQAHSDEMTLLERQRQTCSQENRLLRDELQERTDEKELLEELLEYAKEQAEEATTDHENAIRRLELKLEMLERERERNAGGNTREADERLRQAQDEVESLEQYILEQQETMDALLASENSLRQKLQEARSERALYPQTEVENLEHDVRQQQETINRLVASERSLRQKLELARSERGSAHQSVIKSMEKDIRQQQDTIDTLVAADAKLRQKLDRVRTERSAYLMSVERLQHDLERALRKTSAAGVDAHRSPFSKWRSAGASDEALNTIVRAAESAEERHKKELRGLVMQMEWMQARWQREASLRSDAAYAKRFLQLQLDVANACNKAQLRDLEHIRTRLLGDSKPLALPSSAGKGQDQQKQQQGPPRPTLKSFLVMARFVARMRISAREWAKQEAVRQRLVTATEERRRTKAKRQLKVVHVDEQEA